MEPFARAVYQGQGFVQDSQGFLDLPCPAQGFGQQGQVVGTVRPAPGRRPVGQSPADPGNVAVGLVLLGQGPAAHDQADRLP